MNVLIIGLGSMGKRRLRLIYKHIRPDMIIGVDNLLERRVFCEEEYHIITYSNMNEAFKSYKFDCAFVCTSPLSHNIIISDCLKRKIHVFTELNLVNDGYQENILLAKKNNIVLFLSSTALYREESKFINQEVKNSKKIVNYTYHIGQYLPDWHPWEEINNFFVSDIRTNGCREILAIELPWIIQMFGKVINIMAMGSKVTDLDINYKDNYSILLEHENGSQGVLIVDIVSREAIRRFIAYGEELFIKWEGKPDTLFIKDLNTGDLIQKDLYNDIDKLDGYSSSIIENHYLDEIKQFIKAIEGKAGILYGFEDDIYTIELIDEIEKRVGNSGLE